MSRRADVRDAVRARANGRCEYCQSSEAICGQTFEIEHIVPRVAGGTDTLDNVAFACRACNAFKGTATTAVDVESGQTVRLFDPRADAWFDHFMWDTTGANILPRSAVGRATVEVLRLNGTLRVAARSIWVAAGWHPPA